jgi:eukaryotic-like serine/threonine-protein kinase
MQSRSATSLGRTLDVSPNEANDGIAVHAADVPRRALAPRLDRRFRGAENSRRLRRGYVDAMDDISAIGPYRILEPLGHGGMGVVYRARHIGTERAVALKTVKVTAPRWLDSIRREIDALTRIKHPGVIRIVDHGVQYGRPWYAMDLLEGESLRHFGQRIWSPFRVPSTPIGSTDGVSVTDGVSGSSPGDAAVHDVGTDSRPPARPGGLVPAAAGELRKVLKLMRRVCATLAFLHGEGFVNCDLKPENVLLVGDNPIVIDFGLTAHHPGGSGREALEALRSTSGTLPYMSPEQLRGEFVDARSDIYSIGCVLYELVTGHPPFSGPPRSIMMQHLSSAPVPPSELVADVPPALERVILKLLEKGLSERFGFADEVAAVLAEMAGDAHRLPDFPPVRPYLYRPRFVGREEVVSRLARLRDRAAAGSGALVLLGGESGVGKTRVAMELTRVVPGSRMRVVTGESTSLSAASAESGGVVGTAPLHTLRPLLQAVADRCQEGGADISDQLLGSRRSVLALYEPLLAQVPSHDSMAPVLPLAADASRRRLFTYLSETLAAFAQEQPVLWVLDDLGWADELSLDFLKSLTADYLEATPVFLLGTYRSEETTDDVAAISQLPHVTHLTLPRLAQGAVSSMIADMLAMPEATEGFVDFVTRQAEGNPFFVAEHVRTAVSERVLYRDQQHSWQLLARSGQGPAEYESLPIPRSLREHIEQRLRKLTPAAQQTGLAAAVLGREAAIETLREVAAISDEAAVAALDELLRRQVFEQPEAGRVRFAHDKLREVTYAQAPAERVGELHARAAVALEARWRHRADASQIWAALGHHFAVGRRPDEAARYLKLAADHARATYANGDAIRLYREAINQTNQAMLRLSGDSIPSQETVAVLYEALGDVLALVGKRDEARAAYDEGMGRTEPGKAAVRARLYRKIGKTWEWQHRDDESLRHYELARKELPQDPAFARPDEREEWIAVRLEQLYVFYFLRRENEMDASVADLDPAIATHGTAAQRAIFFQGKMMRGLLRDWWVTTSDTLQYSKLALEACSNDPASAHLPMARFGLGFALLLQNSFEEASRELHLALGLAERAGDTSVQARCLTYLSLAARMRGDVDDTEAYAERAATASSEAGTEGYLAVAQGNRAWLAFQRGKVEESIHFGDQAMRVWGDSTVTSRTKGHVYPFQWVALLPLLRSAVLRNDLGRGSRYAAALIRPDQMALPSPAREALGRALTWRDTERTSEIVVALQDALAALQATPYR